MKGRPNLIQKQVGNLFHGILTASRSARIRKKQLRMLLDAEELQSYLTYAFNHFASTLSTPFDFVQASFSNSPVPLSFGGNILKLAICLMEVWKDKVSANTLFQELSYMVASCIMLDAAKQKNKGMANYSDAEYLLIQYRKC
jgi:hypothetical protein